MSFSILTPKAGRGIIALALTAALVQPVSGCSWAKRMGGHLPVSSSAQRCEGRWFCFGDEAKQPEAEAMRRPANMEVPPESMPMPPSPEAPPPEMMQPQQELPPGAPPAMMMPRSEVMPVYKLPKNEEDAKKLPEGMPNMAPPSPDSPPGMMPEAARPIPGLKPHEQSGPDMSELPPVPVVETVKELGW